MRQSKKYAECPPPATIQDFRANPVIPQEGEFVYCAKEEDPSTGHLAYVACVDGENVYLFWVEEQSMDIRKSWIRAVILDPQPLVLKREIRKLVGVFPTAAEDRDEKFCRVMGCIAEDGYTESADIWFTQDLSRIIIRRAAFPDDGEGMIDHLYDGTPDTEDDLSDLIKRIRDFTRNAVGVMTGYNGPKYPDGGAFAKAVNEYEDSRPYTSLCYLRLVDKWFGYNTDEFFTPTQEQIDDHVREVFQFYRWQRSLPVPKDEELKSTIVKYLTRRFIQQQQQQQKKHIHVKEFVYQGKKYIGVYDDRDHCYRELPSILSILSEKIEERRVRLYDAVFLFLPITADHVFAIVAYADERQVVFYTPQDKKFLMRKQPVYVLKDRPIPPATVQSWKKRVGSIESRHTILDWLVRTLHEDMRIRFTFVPNRASLSAYASEQPVDAAALAAEATKLVNNVAQNEHSKEVISELVDTHTRFFSKGKILYCPPLNGFIRRDLEKPTDEEERKYIREILILINGRIVPMPDDFNAWKTMVSGVFKNKKLGKKQINILPSIDGKEVLVAIFDPSYSQIEYLIGSLSNKNIVDDVLSATEQLKKRQQQSLKALKQLQELLLTQQENKTKKKKRRPPPPPPAAEPSAKQRPAVPERKQQQRASPPRPRRPPPPPPIQQPAVSERKQQQRASPPRPRRPPPPPIQQQQPQRRQRRAGMMQRPVFLEEISEHYENTKHFNTVLKAAGQALIDMFSDLRTRPQLTTVVAVLAVLNPILRKKYGAVLMLKGGGAFAYWVKSKARDFDFRLCARGMDTDQRLELIKNVFDFIRWFMREHKTTDIKTGETRLLNIPIIKPTSPITPISVYKLKIQKEEAIDVIGMAGGDDDCSYVDVPLGDEAVLSVIAHDELITEWIRNYCVYASDKQSLKISKNRIFIEKTKPRLRELFPELVDRNFTDDVIEYLSRRFPAIDRACFRILQSAFKK